MLSDAFISRLFLRPDGSRTLNFDNVLGAMGKEVWQTLQSDVFSVLTKLSINQLQIAERWIVPALKNMPALEAFDARANNKLSDTTLTTLAHHCPNLKRLNVNFTSVTSTGVRTVLEHCSNLSVLKIADCARLGSKKDMRSLFAPVSLPAVAGTTSKSARGKGRGSMGRGKKVDEEEGDDDDGEDENGSVAGSKRKRQTKSESRSKKVSSKSKNQPRADADTPASSPPKPLALKLVNLKLRNSKLDSESLQSIVQQCWSTLEVLDITGTGVTNVKCLYSSADADTSGAAGSGNGVHVHGIPGGDGSGGAFVLPRLRKLNISGCRIPSPKQLNGLIEVFCGDERSRLKELIVGDCKAFRNETLEAYPHILVTKLRKLAIFGNDHITNIAPLLYALITTSTSFSDGERTHNTNASRSADPCPACLEELD
ncbi:hypothetical protein HK102_010608, partial [Quaeritorhiza haematococci]